MRRSSWIRLKAQSKRPSRRVIFSYLRFYLGEFGVLKLLENSCTYIHWVTMTVARAVAARARTSAGGDTVGGARGWSALLSEG